MYQKKDLSTSPTNPPQATTPRITLIPLGDGRRHSYLHVFMPFSHGKLLIYLLVTCFSFPVSK